MMDRLNLDGPGDTIRGRRNWAPRLGRASARLLGLLVLVALGVFLYFRLSGPEAGASGSPEDALRPDQKERSNSDQATDSVQDLANPELRLDRELEDRAPTLPRFGGKGSIRGLVTVLGAKPLPAEFTVHVGPSESLYGREHAVARAIVVQSDEFALDALPMGGYDVWIDAAGMNSQRTPVLVSEASADPYVVLRVSPTGFIDGYVMTQDGRPAQDLRVALEEMFGEGRVEVKTRNDGSYRFEDVRDGEYRLQFGPLHAPLVPARDLAFQAPSMHFPKIELPPTADILIHTTDPAGRAVGEVTITGFGKPTGRIEVVSDFNGVAWARNLPPGQYKVSARTADDKRGTLPIVVEHTTGQEYWLAVR